MTNITKQLAAACAYENVTPEIRRFQSSASNGLVLDARAEIERLRAMEIRNPDRSFLFGVIAGILIVVTAFTGVSLIASIRWQPVPQAVGPARGT